MRFGRYESLFRISAGGMAEVFAARASGEGGFEKIVAVKRILPHLLHDARFVRMFLDEARVAAYVDSPHVVQTLDVGRDADGAPYLAMELVIGLTLAELIRISRRAGLALPIEVAVEIVAQASEGLHDAHEARTPRGEPLGLVHRDISPQNVLVGADGRARVSDFGIASVALERLAETQAGELKGKFSYASPEQSRMQPLDRRSDVFAMGIVAWEAISGRRLFATPSPLDALQAVRHAPIPTLLEMRADVPAELDRVVQRALLRDRDARWPTARELASALRGALPAPLAARARPESVAAWIAEVRPERITELQSRLRQATESPNASSAITDLVVDDSLPDKPDIGEAVTRLLANGEPTTALSSPSPSVATVLPTSPATATELSPSPSRRPRALTAVVLVAGVAVAIGLGLLAWQSFTGDEDIVARPLVPRAPAAPAIAAAPPVAATSSPSPSPMPTPLAEPTPQQPIAADVAPESPGTRPRGNRRTGRTSRTNPEATARPTSPATPPQPSSQRRALGLEEFDRSVGN